MAKKRVAVLKLHPRGYRLTRDRKLEHVVVAESALGRPLPTGAEVHHVNGVKTDNRPENLVICPSAAYHALLHRRTRAMEECGNANWLKCPYCKKYDDPANLYIRGRHQRHRDCFNTAWLTKHRERKTRGAQAVVAA